MATISPSTPKVTRRLRIYGHVQGVFFRESMRRRALELGVAGWVRNCNDGSVEAVLQGSPQAVDELIRWAHRGPERARVDRVEVSVATGEFSGFERLPSV